MMPGRDIGARELTELSLGQVAGLLGAAASGKSRARPLSPVELTEACLRRIEQLNPRLNAFTTITADTALNDARSAEAEIHAGRWRGPLHGIPLALKDLVDTAGIRTTAGSLLYRDRVPQQDAEVVRRLRAAGAVIVGKTNLHEFAFGGSGMISAFGVTRNPWDTERITGGSSSGSAAAVAAGMCFGAIGTDTAGSIRLPAAYCGIVGFKPSYGLVSQRGVVPLSWSYDHVGPMARTVADAVIILRAIAGYDSEDVYSQNMALGELGLALEQSTRRLRVGVPREPFFRELDGEVEKQVNAALEVIQKLTAGLREVTIPSDPDRTVSSAETYAYHAENVTAHPEMYQPETVRRILSGRDTKTTDYIRKWQDLQLGRRTAGKLFAGIDVVVTPAAPVPPPTIAELEAQMENLRQRELIMLRNTRPFNVLGLPAISVPCGRTAAGLPVGLQIAAAPGREDMVVALAQAYERAVGGFANCEL
jgi:aspartyl-tRNA(Asn)/glutamyl-tRNA(Gln) amidotransferase subunit A